MYSTYFSGDFYTRTNKLFRCCPSFIIFPYKQNHATGIPQLPNKPEWWHLAKQHQIVWLLQSSEDASWHKYSLMLHENTSTWCMLVRTSPTNSEGCWAASKTIKPPNWPESTRTIAFFHIVGFHILLGKRCPKWQNKKRKVFLTMQRWSRETWLNLEDSRPSLQILGCHTIRSHHGHAR